MECLDERGLSHYSNTIDTYSVHGYTHPHPHQLDSSRFRVTSSPSTKDTSSDGCMSAGFFMHHGGSTPRAWTSPRLYMSPGRSGRSSRFSIMFQQLRDLESSFCLSLSASASFWGSRVNWTSRSSIQNSQSNLSSPKSAKTSTL